MLSQYIPKRYATAMLKHVVAVSLFFPYVYSKSVNFYYADFILANFFAILAMIFILTSWKLDFKRNGVLIAGMGILLIAYNVFATYMNYTYHHWYGEQINTTISFLLFMVLLMVKEPHALIDHTTIRSIIHMMVITNVISICYRLFTGYNSFFIMNDYAKTVNNFENTIEQYSWIYLHKSQYGLILIVCIAFCTVYRKMFRNIFTYLLTLGILFFALYLSNAYTSLVAVILIFVGQFLDYLLKFKWWKQLLIILLLGVPGIIGCIQLYEIIIQNRDLLTIGGRTHIWTVFIDKIINNPNGIIDNNFSITHYYYKFSESIKVYTNNCHNVFLNHMFRFSIPVGGIYCSLFIMLFLFYIKRHFSFQSIFIFIAYFITLNMDYSLTSVEITLFLFILFCKYNYKISKAD